MPARGATNNTMSEGLARVIAEIAQLKMAPDADIDFLTGLETSVLGYVKQRISGVSVSPQAMAGQGASPAMGPMPVSMAGPGAGVRPRPAMPNPDELRRLLQTEGAG